MAIVLEELGLKYETKFLDMATEMKAKPFTDKNPNGRLEHFSQIPECHVSSDRLGLVLGLVTATWLAWRMVQLPLQCTKAILIALPTRRLDRSFSEKEETMSSFLLFRAQLTDSF